MIGGGDTTTSSITEELIEHLELRLATRASS
jgi:hypothetical protein